MDEIIQKIEKNINTYKYSFQMGDEFISLRDTGNDNEKKQAQWEIDAFNFVISRGGLQPKFQSSGKNGEIITYPSIKRFDNEAYSYFINRLDKSAHPTLVSIYSTILWNSPKKHTKFATKAIEAFISLADFYRDEDLKDLENKNHFGLSVINSIENAFFIALSSKNEKLNSIKRKLIDLIINYPESSSSSFALKINLTELALENKFSKSDLKKCKIEISKMGNNFLKTKQYHRAIDTFQLAGRLCWINENKKCDVWLKKQAKCFEAMSLVKNKQPDMSHLHNCEQAILLYKKLKNIKKIKLLSNRYEKLKSNQVLNKISVPLDDNLGKKIRENNDNLSRKISEKTTPEIISILTFSQFVLPDVKRTKKVADEISSKYVFTHLANMQVFDNRNNTPEKFFDDSSKEKFEHIRQYMLTFELSYADLLHRILYFTIAKNGLFMKEVLEYLDKESWYSKTLNRKTGTDVVKYKWIDVLAPALNDYYIEYRKYVLGRIEPNFVLTIDSLALKIEGIIRDLCRIKKIPTTFFKENGTTIEADLPKLLQIPELIQIIDDDDIFLLKIVLTEKSAYNLRHQVAHSLMVYDNYSIVYANLLFIIILRLGKYQLNKTK
ncbi:MAG: DUF4209 domain-containing protein [Clostridia bacterium]|nr:DUF4209 domain-containing protein [Clostridia bacterium]